MGSASLSPITCARASACCSLALALILGLLITALELSAGSHARSHVRRSAVADVVTGRGEDPSLPSVPEVDQAPPSTSPAITY